MEKRWIYEEIPSKDIIQSLSSSINVNTVLATILAQRGITNYTQAEQFFNPSLDQLHDPFLMADMKQAIDRLVTAIDGGEKIMIYGDYDVDGTTSVALAYGYLSKVTPNCLYYINDREEEGYGISEKGIDHAIREKVNLIISLDCGIKAVSMVEKSANHGIDFIICDHHTPGEELPEAIAVLDPKRGDCSYPYKELSGCGIGYKLLQALEMRTGWNNDLPDYLDLVCVSIAADIVPLTGENRVLCSLGLVKLRESPRPGLKALKDMSAKEIQNINSVIFGIAPRINAAGRIAHANFAVELLLAATEEDARSKAMAINKNNDRRRDFDLTITQEALEMLAREEKGKKSTVLYKEDWHKGVIGIVASRCIEHYYRPTVILTRSNGSVTGSARSVPGFDIYSAIKSCEDILEKFGGHTFAAGLTLPVENVEAFRVRFEEAVSSTIEDQLLIPAINLSAELPFDYISEKFITILDRMEPFGPENPSPVFVSHKVGIYGQPRLLKNEHIKMSVIQEGSTNILDAIGFGLKDLYKDLCKNPVMSIAYSVELNEYMGARKVQLRIKDIKID